MRTDMILYDRIWLNSQVDCLSYQRDLLRRIEDALQKERFQIMPEQQPVYGDVLEKLRELAHSLEVTERVMKEYLAQVQNAAIRLQKECQDIELPNFFTGR